MRAFKLIPILAIAGLAGLSGAAHAALPSSLSFDGYCDVITDIHYNAGVVTGIWDLSACGYGSTTTAGLSSSAKGVAGVTGTYDVTTFGFAVAVVRLNEDNTFFYYLTDGTLFNSGTWSPGVAQSRFQSSRISLSR